MYTMDLKSNFLRLRTGLNKLRAQCDCGDLCQEKRIGFITKHSP